MSFSLPNPTSPTDGQPLDATPILANLVAIQQAIDSFDGSQVQAKSITEQALADAINPRLRGLETVANFVYTGCLWSSVSGLSGTMTGGTIYMNGYRVVVTAIGSHTFTASNDTYIYIDNLGNVTYQGVSNNSTSPSLAANSILVAIVVTGGSSISFVNTGQTDTTLSGFAPIVSSIPYCVTDAFGNLIYPTSPNPGIIGYRELAASNFTGSSNSSFQSVTGLTAPFIATGKKIKATFFGNFFNGTNTATVVAALFESSAELNSTKIIITASNTPGGETVLYIAFPSAGLHTYQAQVQVPSSGVPGVEIGPSERSFVMIEQE